MILAIRLTGKALGWALESKEEEMRLEELPELVTPDELAEVLRVHPNTVRNMCKRGELASTRVGKRWYINRDAALGEAMKKESNPMRSRSHVCKQ